MCSILDARKDEGKGQGTEKSFGFHVKGKELERKKGYWTGGGGEEKQ